MKTNKTIGYEKVLGQSIKGGDYFEIFYYNNDNESCQKKTATKCIIYEKLNNGSIVHTLHLSL